MPVPIFVPVVVLKMIFAASAMVREVVTVGVVMLGEVEKTRLVVVVPVVPAAENPVMLLKQVMVAVEQLVPPFATGRTPVTPVVSGSPVALVRVPEDGVPKAPPETKLPLAVPVKAPTKVVALTVLAKVAD